jgi:hypothetical protein
VPVLFDPMFVWQEHSVLAWNVPPVHQEPLLLLRQRSALDQGNGFPRKTYRQSD